MNDRLNRRQALGRTAAGLASLFCLGRLEFKPGRSIATAADELSLAAAATFEFAIQQLCIPYGSMRWGNTFAVSSELRSASYEISKLLKPSNAPALFGNAEVFARGPDIVVRFNAAVSHVLSKRTVGLLRPFLEIHPNALLDVSVATDLEVVEYLLIPFTRPECWIDD